MSTQDAYDQLTANAIPVLVLLADISRGEEPKQGSKPCPRCKTGQLRWDWRGPRSFVIACTTPDCVHAIG